MFEAWTKPELLSEWLKQPDGTAQSSVDLRVGGKYCQNMIKGDTESNCNSGAKKGDTIPHEGEYLEIKPPEKIVFTWNSPIVKNSRVTVEFRELGDSTELWLTHELLPDEATRNAHHQGWEACFSQLEQLLTA